MVGADVVAARVVIAERKVVEVAVDRGLVVDEFAGRGRGGIAARWVGMGIGDVVRGTAATIPDCGR